MHPWEPKIVLEMQEKILSKGFISTKELKEIAKANNRTFGATQRKYQMLKKTTPTISATPAPLTAPAPPEFKILNKVLNLTKILEEALTLQNDIQQDIIIMNQWVLETYQLKKRLLVFVDNQGFIQKLKEVD